MKNKIQALISIIKVAQDHVAELKGNSSANAETRRILVELGIRIGQLLEQLEELNVVAEAT